MRAGPIDPMAASMSLNASLLRLFLRYAVKRFQDPDAPVADLRTMTDRLAFLFPSPPRDARVARTKLGSRDALVIDAAGADPDRAILYLHGGGYVTGTIEMYRDLAHRLSRAARARIYLVDYRLAPEHRFPAAVDDALDAYRALLDLGHPAARLAIAGDSAGGGLTFATLVSIRSAELPMPSGAWVMSPWTDLAYRGASLVTNRDADPMIRAEVIGSVAAWYLGTASPESPLASPLHAELHGLPATLVHVGSTEILLDDSTRIVERLRAHGGAAELRVFDDLPHVFHLFAPYVREARDAIDEAGRFLAGQMG